MQIQGLLMLLEKHVWICAFMAVGVKHQCTVGEVATTHEAEIRAVINELSAAAAKVRRDLLFKPCTRYFTLDACLLVHRKRIFFLQRGIG